MCALHLCRTFAALPELQEYCDCGTLSSWVSKVLQTPTDNNQLAKLLLLLQVGTVCVAVAPNMQKGAAWC